MKIIIVQPALPSYRLDFFRRLADHYGEGLVVYYSPTEMGALTMHQSTGSWSRELGPVHQPVRGLEWQAGALRVPVAPGDIVVVCGAPRTISTLCLLLRVRMIGAKSVWWGQYWGATTKAFRHRARMWLTKLADSLLFYTDAEVSRFHAEGWSHQGIIRGLNNGVDLTEIRRLRTPYSPADRGQNVLFIGRLTDKARLDLLVKAISDTRLRRVCLHVIGEGKLEKELQALAAEYRVTERIFWHGGITDEALIAQVANRCAVFVYPGQVGLSLIHSMGYGLPSILHDQPLHHMPEIAAFDKGNTGLTFSEGKLDSLVDAVSAFFAASEVAIARSERSIQIVENGYSTELMASRFIKFIECFVVKDPTGN